MSNQVIKEDFTDEFVEKNSRFIGIGVYCDSESSFKNKLKSLKRKYQGCSHITFAYSILEKGRSLIRCSDDGEPAGTAGRPILNHIQGNNLINIAIFVIRYFGGTKLGAGGLVKAYSHGAKLVVEGASFAPYIELKSLQLEVDYSRKRHMDYCLEKFSGVVISCVFEANLKYTVQIPSALADDFLHLLNSK